MLHAPMPAAGRSTARQLALIAAVTAATFLFSFTSLAATVHAAAPGATSTSATQASSARTTAAAAAKKAVIVVGPVGGQTADYTQAARDIGNVLSAAGVDVRLILPPHATWSAVVAEANGADFFAYLGHGNGWPSPYPPFQEDSKDGLGLNPTDGDTNTNNVKYYGANIFRAAIRLAPNAIVLLNRLCYADGNGEPGMAIPTQDVAFQRVDNFASGFLAAGARVVFALGWQPGADLASALVNAHQTMDGFFMTRARNGSDPYYQPYNGWVGWKPNVYLSSVRTPGASAHLDPHQTNGYLRSVTGDLAFTIDEWWSTGASNDVTPPTVTDLSSGASANTTPAGTDLTPVFTPNGDGISDSLTIMHTLSEPAYLDVAISRADTGALVRKFTSYSEQGATSDAWDGKNSTGAVVNDGLYRIRVTPKDRAGNIGAAVTTTARVLTAMRSPAASPKQFYAADGDALAQTQVQSVTLDQPADLTWVVKSGTGSVVRHVMAAEPRGVGVVSWTWDGKDDTGAYVPDGSYRMSITAATAQGAYRHELVVLVSPFKVTASTWTASAGQNIKLTIIATEAQTGWPRLTVRQPGLKAYTVSLVKWSTTKFLATITLKAGGTPGTVRITIAGTDVNGGVDTRSYNATIL